jgi:hypothetical protein
MAESEATRKRKDYLYHSSPLQKKRRAARNKARRKAARMFGKASIRGKDIDHKDGNPKNNSNGNLRVMSRKKNRGRNNGPKGLGRK